MLEASFNLQQHLIVTYQEPSYQPTSGIFDPTVDALELSGLAMAYAAIRNDESDAPIAKAWIERIGSLPEPTTAAKSILEFLDAVDGSYPFGISPRDFARTEWERKLANRIVEAGYAKPESFFAQEPPVWNAPWLIRLLDVQTRMPSIMLKPRAIFAAEIIGPLSEEPAETLRKRSSLKRYFERIDLEERQGSRRRSTENEPQDTEVASA